MFEIHPAADDRLVLLAEQEGLDLPLCGMVLQDNGEEEGYLLYRVYGDTASIVCCRCADAGLGEWLVRAALAAAANREALYAVCTDEGLFDVLTALGFEREEGRVSVFIPDFFNQPCAGCGSH